MKKLLAIIYVLCSLTTVGMPVTAGAEELPGSVNLAPVVITEVQPGTDASPSQEFIELYNTTEAPIDLEDHYWQLVLAGSTAKNWDKPYRTIELSGIIAPGQSYIVASRYTSAGREVGYLNDQAREWFSAGMSSAGGHLRLTYSTNQEADSVCTAASTVVDEVEWSGSAAGQAIATSIDGRTIYNDITGAGIAPSVSLQRKITDQQKYLDTNNDSQDFVTASPTPGFISLVTGLPLPGENQISPAAGLPVDGCDPNIPAGQDGSTETPDPSQDPSTEGPGVINGTNNSQALPFISEILPNPASPQTDADDEFIELYNPNDTEYDISNYVLEAGETTIHSYVFPIGTVLAPQSYTVFYSADTGLTLSNSGSKVRLLTADGSLVSETDSYTEAADGQSWAYIDSRWQWTATPTPDAINQLILPTPKAKKVAKASTTAKKAATAKNATKAAAKTSAKKNTGSKSTAGGASATAASRAPLHLGVLAAVGVFALLYGAYEYRHDVANKFRKFRHNRANG